LRKRSVFLFPLRLGQVLRRVGADLVHTNLTAHIAAQAKAVLQFQHLPLVWTVHGLYRSRGEDTPDWPTAFRLVRCSDRAVIVGVSRAALDDVLGDVTLPAGKTRVVYNGIDLTKFSFCGKADTSLRNLWGIPPTATIFGSAGRLIPVKRFDVLIKAAALVIAAHPNVHLVIAGEGPLSEELRHLAYTLGVQEHVHLVGYQPDMERFWANVDVGVIASDSESYSLALLEACASGIPCIGTRVGGIPEVIGDGAGILVEPGSPAALAEAMKHMLDPEVRAAMGQRARAAAERFPLDVTAAQYAELYRELLEKSRGKNHAHACH
jgi:glycosyltransferase involved in cell wall biosynthesis